MRLARQFARIDASRRTVTQLVTTGSRIAGSCIAYARACQPNDAKTDSVAKPPRMRRLNRSTANSTEHCADDRLGGILLNEMPGARHFDQHAVRDSVRECLPLLERN